VHDCGVWSRRGQHQAEAVKAGDRDAVRVLLAQHEDVKAPEPDGTTALHWAVLSDDPVTVRLLLQASANVDAANRYGVTPLQIAATNGNPKVIEALLEAGADPNVVLPEGKTVLMTAARSGRVEAVNLLLAYGADASAKEQLVRRNGPHLGCCRESCGRGARVGQEWRRRQRPLEYADLAASGRTARRVDAADVCGPSGCARRGARLVDDCGAPLNETDADGTTALQVAILNAHWDVAAALLERGADPNGRGPDRHDPTCMPRSIYRCCRRCSVGQIPSPPGRQMTWGL
jgi:uncharacterized protein